MKYRALKDFVGYNGHFFKAGEVVDYSDVDPHYVPLQNLIASLLKFGFIEEIKDEPWKPKVGDGYYFISGIGYPCYEPSFCYDTEDDERLAIGNYFRTEEQARKAVEWIKAFKVLREDTKGFKPDSTTFQHCVFYDMEYGKLMIGPSDRERHTLIYFATHADAEESIKKHEKEWKVFLGVEEGE